jgi:bacteriorhodopsin
VAISLNAKDENLFRWGLFAAAVLAFFLLVIRAAKVKYDAATGNDKTAGKALEATAKDFFGFWAPTVVALGAAGVAMVQIYSGDVGWGADPLSSGIALAGTAISAAGLGTFLSSLRGS